MPYRHSLLHPCKMHGKCTASGSGQNLCKSNVLHFLVFAWRSLYGTMFVHGCIVDGVFRARLFLWQSGMLAGFCWCCYLTHPSTHTQRGFFHLWWSHRRKYGEIEVVELMRMLAAFGAWMQRNTDGWNGKWCIGQRGEGTPFCNTHTETWHTDIGPRIKLIKTYSWIFINAQNSAVCQHSHKESCQYHVWESK